MNPRWEESEYVFCDLQTAARHIQRETPAVAQAFLEAAYDTFELVASQPGMGRCRADLGFPEVRSWRIGAFRCYLIFYRQLPDRVEIWRVLHGARDLHRGLNEYGKPTHAPA